MTQESATSTLTFIVKILELQHQLCFPDVICLPNCSVESESTALSILFTWLALPGCHCNLSWISGRERSVLGRIERYTWDFVLQQWCHLLKWSPHRMNPKCLENIANSLQAHKNCPLDNVVGYILLVNLLFLFLVTLIRLISVPLGAVWQVCEWGWSAPGIQWT